MHLYPRPYLRHRWGCPAVLPTLQRCSTTVNVAKFGVATTHGVGLESIRGDTGIKLSGHRQVASIHPGEEVIRAETVNKPITMGHDDRSGAK